MIYHLSLQTAGFISGAFLLLVGLPGLLRPALVQSLTRHFPRSFLAGVVLLTIDLVWSFWLLSTMEMGEFASFRRPLLIALPIGYVLVLRFMQEFLAVRALGILCLLAAEPLLDAAFVTVFAYLLVVAGLFWVPMPYLLRDQITWSTRNNARWRFMHGIAVAYGAVILALAITQY